MASRNSKPRVFRRSDGYTEASLAEAARDHMRAALILFEKGPFYYDSAGYLAHLAIELLFKVMLLLVRDEFPGEHDLQALLRLLHQEIPDLEVTEAGEHAVSLVNRFKELRYPKPEDPIEIGSDNVDLFARLYSTFWEFIPEEVRPTVDSTGWVTKGGRVLMRRPKHSDSPSNNALQRTGGEQREPPAADR